MTPAQTGNNKTYPWWYEVAFSAKGAQGQAEFLAGMFISWQIEITTNNSGTFEHNTSPVYHFTYSGAWPASPYPGANQFAGNAAFGQDVSVRVTPTSPNWNDSMTIILKTNARDAAINATLGNVQVTLAEVASNGRALGTTVFQNLTNGSAGQGGRTEVVVHVPASLDLYPNTTVTYTVSAADDWGDGVNSAPAFYIVGGNGSFPSSFFNEELNLSAGPNVTVAAGQAAALIAPGVPVNLSLTSRNPNDAINQAEVFYAVEVPTVGSTATGTAWFTRGNSTHFMGALPAMPVGAVVGFEVLAWDFTSKLLTSSVYAYSVETLADLYPQPVSIPNNDTFFYVGVYDGGNAAWVTGAHVRILGQSEFLRSVSTTAYGIAYPNATGNRFVPILVPAGATYTINVTDPAFIAPGGTEPSYITVHFTAPHVLSGHVAIATGPTYTVVQNGDVVLFYLNSTAPPPPVAPAAASGEAVAPIVGLVAAAVIVVPLFLWYLTIQRRREQDLKRVTL
jgi:hypothetical protein